MYSVEMFAVYQLCEHDKIKIHTEVKSEMRTGYKDCWHGSELERWRLAVWESRPCG